MSWTTYTVSNFADDVHWPELGILLESIDYHEAVRKASFLGSMCEDPFMAAIHYVIKTDIPDESDVELCQSVKRPQTHSIVTVNILKKKHHLHLVVLSFLLFYKSFNS